METDKEKCSGKVVHIMNIKWDTLDDDEGFLDPDKENSAQAARSLASRSSGDRALSSF